MGGVWSVGTWTVAQLDVARAEAAKPLGQGNNETKKVMQEYSAALARGKFMTYAFSDQDSSLQSPVRYVSVYKYTYITAVVLGCLNHKSRAGSLTSGLELPPSSTGRCLRALNPKASKTPM